MFDWPSSSIFLCCQPIDMRKSIDGLVLLVQGFDHQPTGGSMFVFCNKARDKIKILFWDRNGFCLLYKRLEQGRFHLSYTDSGVIHLSAQQMRWLIDGLDYTKVQGHASVSYSVFC